VRYGVFALVGLLATLPPLCAPAQPASGTSGTLEQIIVTARRVEENLQDTPIAVTVLSGAELTDRQVFNTAELDQVVPNLQFADNAPLAGNNSSSQVFIRGIGQTDPTSTVDPGVGLYIDDVYMGSAIGGTMALRDIRSIQVRHDGVRLDRISLGTARDGLLQLLGGLQGRRVEQPLQRRSDAAQEAALHPFKPETVDTLEAGFKLDLADNTLRVNGALFSSDYTDMQITYRGPAPAGVAPFVTNAGKASIDGAELEVTWAPNDKWTVEASLGTLDATIDELNNIPFAVLPPGLVVGNKLPFAPDRQAHLGLAYKATPGSLVVTPRIDVSYTSETFFDATDTPEIAQLDGFTVVNASVVLAPSASKWRVTVGVNNATDELYAIAGNSSLTTGSGYAEIAYARPREYFATISFDF
jgi:outer membrane receptor protein involved in Fe transport